MGSGEGAVGGGESYGYQISYLQVIRLLKGEAREERPEMVVGEMSRPVCGACLHVHTHTRVRAHTQLCFVSTYVSQDMETSTDSTRSPSTIHRRQPHQYSPQIVVPEVREIVNWRRLALGAHVPCPSAEQWEVTAEELSLVQHWGLCVFSCDEF